MDNIFFQIFVFIYSNDGNFTILDFLKFIDVEPTMDNIRAVRDFMIVNNIAYALPMTKNVGLKEQLWIAKIDFFADKEFTVAPTDFELSEGVLILGSRFSWAVTKYNDVNDIDIILDEQSLEKDSIALHHSYIDTYYFLTNEFVRNNYLCAESEDNVEEFMHFTDDSMFHLTCVSLSELYCNLNFKSGDRLVCRINSFDGQTIEILPKKVSNLSEADINHWKEIFNMSVSEATKVLGIDADIDAVIDLAFFLGSHILFAENPLSLEEALFENDEIKCQDYGFDVKLWPVKVPMPISNFWATVLPVNDMEVNAFFSNIEVPISASILKLFILIFLAEHYLDADDPESINAFIDDFIKDVFPKNYIGNESLVKQAQQLIEKYYKQQLKEYNRFADVDDLIKLRQNAGAFLKDEIMFINYLISVELTPASFENQNGLILNQLLIKSVYLSEYIADVSADADVDIQSMLVSVENMFAMYDSIKLEIKNEINRKHNFT